jgi:aspartate-semialdehyde dehydrogenase
LTLADVDERFARAAAAHLPTSSKVATRALDASNPAARSRGAAPKDWAVARAPRPARRAFRSPGAAAIVAATLSVGLREFPVRRLAASFFHPVSELGQPGIDELESQTTSLLSFQPIGKEVFDTQVAFNMVERYGESSPVRLEDARALVARDISDYLGYRAPMPAVQVLQAPVFYGAAFSVFVEFEGTFPQQILEEALRLVGVSVGAESPSNTSAAGSAEICATLRSDANLPMSWWIWGAVDNVRLAAQNAVRIAENALASKP